MKSKLVIISHETDLQRIYRELNAYYTEFSHDPGDKIYDAVNLLQEAVEIQREEIMNEKLSPCGDP